MTSKPTQTDRQTDRIRKIFLLDLRHTSVQLPDMVSTSIIGVADQGKFRPQTSLKNPQMIRVERADQGPVSIDVSRIQPGAREHDRRQGIDCRSLRSNKSTVRLYFSLSDRKGTPRKAQHHGSLDKT